jgi:hypothetical protein
MALMRPPIFAESLRPVCCAPGVTTAGDQKMKKIFVTTVALGTALAALVAPAFAAPPRHRAPAPVANDTGPYGPLPQERLMAPPNTVVSTEGRVVGADPDPNIRTQLLHDPDPTGF